ncbi:hypothetical protein M758_1G064500 [Ceratodon purpureus]|uniref:Non-haem dioxygenase N-terminal domain-containing protein n=1 Tax=Ceratodon purpureus TaxID=3225 RepID=A0A8T0J5D7_CERPU|nr:hypothetical protein KC19_1G066500 [Ceratodon purpureus]KAG0628940.1 hypothetical protein M758_1G064500 [Ceratodon purpureus]
MCIATKDEFPVLDLHADDEDDKVARLAWVAKTWGFFKVVNHGVPPAAHPEGHGAHTRDFLYPIRAMRLERNGTHLVSGTSPSGYILHETIHGRFFLSYILAPGTMIVDVDGKHLCWTERLLFTPQKEAI